MGLYLDTFKTKILNNPRLLHQKQVWVEFARGFNQPCKILSEIDTTDNVYQKQIQYDIAKFTQLITLTIGVTDKNIFDVILEIENRLKLKIKIHTIRYTANNLSELKDILNNLNKEIRKINASCLIVRKSIELF